MTWEKIKYVDGFDIKPNTYIVNEYGEVRRISDKSVVAQRKGNYGHASVTLNIIPILDDKTKATFKCRQFGVHRIVGNVFIEVQDNRKFVVDHIDFNPENNHVSNLRFITQKDNIRHSIKAGRFKVRGMDNGNNKMLESDIIKICEFLQEDKLTYDEISTELGLEPSRKYRDIITKIKTGHIWAHITKDYKFNIVKRKSMGSHAHLRDDVIRLFEEGWEIAEMYIMLGIPHIRSERDKFYKFAKRIQVKLD